MIRRLLIFLFFFSYHFLYAQKFTELALTPPMGWNSWNCFECDVHEQLIREIADAMIASGMKDAGYEYIVIDDCWQVDRDKDGFIVADPQRFPSGIKALADYVHDKGLKFGLYSCAGQMTCAKRPGSRGHEFQDAIMYARWGVDYLKYDWCNTEGQTAQESYSLMRDALYATGRPVVFSLCEWGLNKPWEWAAGVGHLWRTTGDIRNNWDIPDAKEGKVWAGGVIINLDMQQGLEKYAGPGHWNDPDMLQVGNGVLTESENRAHFSLWCMLAAPLMAGNDLRTMTPAVRDLLTNREVIAVNQDSLGKQGYKIRDDGEFEIFYKLLSGRNLAICLFNRHDTEFKVTIDWKTLQIKETCRIRDLWKHEYCGDTGRNFTVTIPAHDVIMLKLEKAE
ncbi:MAG TPA: glycoside hydrolase family 27 protein [bacterium]|nr:glycoside hydrolase family 27 protein [bacterium]HPN43331.1 glycoside hydrolase family 27 protein [bacterium]